MTTGRINQVTTIPSRGSPPNHPAKPREEGRGGERRASTGSQRGLRGPERRRKFLAYYFCPSERQASGKTEKTRKGRPGVRCSCSSFLFLFFLCKPLEFFLGEISQDMRHGQWAAGALLADPPSVERESPPKPPPARGG